MTKHIGHEIFDKILSNMGAIELLGGEEVELHLYSDFNGYVGIGDIESVFRFNNPKELLYGLQDSVRDIAEEKRVE